LVSYPHDPGRVQQLLTEAGFTRGSDNFWTGPADGRLTFEVKTNTSSQNDAEVSILGAAWRQAGIDAREAIVPTAQAQNAEIRNLFPGLYAYSTPLGEESLAGHTSAGIPRVENRWVGNNRSAWSNPEFDRVANQLAATLAANEREQRIAELLRIFSDDIPVIPLYFNPIPIAHVAALRGPAVVAPDAAIAWNIHQWEF
jgi:peptide/nickel transport system substrate-binding protein